MARLSVNRENWGHYLSLDFRGFAGWASKGLCGQMARLLMDGHGGILKLIVTRGGLMLNRYRGIHGDSGYRREDSTASKRCCHLFCA